MTSRWVEKQVRLKVRLGEIPLFSIHVPLLVLDAHFTDLVAQEPQRTWSELPASVAGTLISSKPVRAPLPRLCVLPDAIRYVPQHYERFYVDVRGSFAEYLDKFSAKSRATLRRKLKRFAGVCGGTIEWREFRQPDAMESFYGLARAVSEKTYQERLLGVGLPADPQFRQELHALARQDRARGYILFHHAQPIAYLFCSLRDGGLVLYRYLGYDPQFRRWSPGTLLTYLVLEKLFTEGGARVFDFTEGGGAQKQFFATGSTQCADVYELRRTVANYLVVVLHAAADSVSTAAVRLLDAIGLKARVKRFVRSRA